MIFMAMGENNPFYLVFDGVKIGKIRNNQVNSQSLLIGEHGTAIHNDRLVIGFIDHAVERADLAYSSQRGYFYFLPDHYFKKS